MVAERSESAYKTLGTAGTQPVEATVFIDGCLQQSVSLVRSQ